MWGISHFWKGGFSSELKPLVLSVNGGRVRFEYIVGDCEGDLKL